MACFRKYQSGVTLIELILVLGLISLITVIDFERKNLELKQAQAKIVGNLLATYNGAVRAWLSANVGAPDAVKIGSQWLKHTSCGGESTIAYLPCNFPDATPESPISFGKLSLASTLKTTGAAPDQVSSITTRSSAFILGENEIRSDLAGISAMVAASTSGGFSNPSGLTTDATYRSDPRTAVITMVARNNGFDDAWLRTDGSNQMHSNITFNPSKSEILRQINNLSRIQSFPGMNLFIGNKGGSGTGAQVVVDADQDILGDLHVSRVIKADGNIESRKTIKASENIEAAKDMVAQHFYDADNRSFYVDPASKTHLNELLIKGKSTFEDTVTLNKVVARGSPCPEVGAMARTDAGAVLSCQAGRWSDISSQLSMQAPRLIFSGSDAQSWVTTYLPEAPATAKYVQLQYEFTIAYPDGAPNSTIYSRAGYAFPEYIVTAGRSAGERDSGGGAGQVIVPFNPDSKTMQLRVNQLFGGGFYRVYAIGFL